jgi:hypothetical protein
MAKWLSWACGLLFLAGKALAGEDGYRFEAVGSEAVFHAANLTEGFRDRVGFYTGLILDPTNVVAEQSGSIRLTVEFWGGFSGRMEIGGDSVPLRGRFDSSGHTRFQIYRRVWDDCCFSRWRLVWIVTLDLADEVVQGSVENFRKEWETPLIAYRADTTADSRGAARGRYTLALPGSADAQAAPGGDGFATLKVSRHGRLSVQGRLADGTAFSEAVGVSTNGWWPFYISQSNGEGACIGWVRFVPSATNDLSGDLVWIKPTRPDRALYPAGFTNHLAVIGSAYERPGSTQPMLTWTHGTVVVMEGELAGPLSNAVTLRLGGRVEVGPGSIPDLSLSVSPSTGLFKGTFRHPAQGRTRLYGVWLQKEDIGTGYFMGGAESGRVQVVEFP